MTAPETTNGTLHHQMVRAERLLEPIMPKLLLVEEELHRHFRSRIKTIQDVGEHILAGGGKRLRPALLLLVADMLGYRGKSDVTLGAVVEFVHTATLVHDDIIDAADVRRGRTSINYRWGNNLTVLVGDFLYSHAMNIALAEDSLDIIRCVLGATIRMIEGEILGVETNGRVDLTIDEYFDIMGRKTGALFGASCRIPAILMNADEATGNALAEYGENLGICFQLIDDLLDFTSSTEVLGKPALSDLKEGKITLPLILALPHATDEERARIRRVATTRSLADGDAEGIVAVVERYGTLDQTRAMAREYADRARRALTAFPPSTSRESLDVALDFVMERDR